MRRASPTLWRALCVATFVSLMASCGDEAPLELTVVTFNVGTSGAGSATHPDGFTEAHEAYADEYYGNGLAFVPGVDAVRAYFAEGPPDIVAFQELFDGEDCAGIPVDARAGFVCEAGDTPPPDVIRSVLGDGYQVACHLEKPDKCAAVRRDVATFEGCDEDRCEGALEGVRIDGCGGGSRIGRATLRLRGGGLLTLVTYHGTSGFNVDDQACRVEQLARIFDDFGDGAPAASGDRVIVLGDFNTDPFRLADFDPSARALADYVQPPLTFHSPAGTDARASYARIAIIDYILGNARRADCDVAGIDPDIPDVYPHPLFDHAPIRCRLTF